MMRDSSKGQVKVPIKFAAGAAATQSDDDDSEDNCDDKPPPSIGNVSYMSKRKRGTPNWRSQELVEERLRASELWEEGVAFHNAVDLQENKDPTFKARRERIRMHQNPDGSVKAYEDGESHKSSKARPKAFGFHAQQAEFLAATEEGDHPMYLELMEEYGTWRCSTT